MSNFSERFGYGATPVDLGETDLPDTLRNGLWDAIDDVFLSDIYDLSGGYDQEFSQLTFAIWHQVFRLPADSRGRHPRDAKRIIREKFYSFEFFEVYNFIEWIYPFARKVEAKRKFRIMVDNLLKRERAAFRFSSGIFVRVSDEESLIAIANALKSKTRPVAEHIETAARLYRDADYRNSVKESISAVEAACRDVGSSRKDGVSKPLRSVLDEYDLHPVMVAGFEKLYAFTSDAEGVRHSLLDKGKISQADARYMLSACSAFSNYLSAKRAEVNGH